MFYILYHLIWCKNHNTVGVFLRKVHIFLRKTHFFAKKFGDTTNLCYLCTANLQKIFELTKFL